MLKTIHSNRLIDWEFLSDLSQMQNTSKWEILVKSNWKLVNKSINADYIETWENNKFVSKSIYENLEKMEIKENKGKKLGYAPLDENAKVPIKNLPFLDLESIFWRFRWNFSSKEKYIKNDRVFYEWSAYIALKDTVWNLPMDENFWWIFVEKWNDWNPGRDWNDWKDGKNGTWIWDMLGVNNLSDLGDIVVARKNLEVFSKYETGKKIENELIKENFAKKVWWNEFVWEQKINWFFRIWNWLSFWQGWHNILWFWIAENTSENSWVVNSEKIPFEMRHTSEAMIFNIENNLKAIWEYYELWNKNSLVIKKWWNVGIWKWNPEAKLDIDWDLKTIWTLIKRWPSADVLNIQTFNNQHWFTIWQSINWNLFIYSMKSWNEVLQIFPNWNIRLNIPSSPAWLSSWDIYWENNILKKVP